MGPFIFTQFIKDLNVTNTCNGTNDTLYENGLLKEEKVLHDNE